MGREGHNGDAIERKDFRDGGLPGKDIDRTVGITGEERKKKKTTRSSEGRVSCGREEK